jgi:hypothetical protein
MDLQEFLNRDMVMALRGGIQDEKSEEIQDVRRVVYER